jgi:drug/metabolite transporter (DMT)-like permease
LLADGALVVVTFIWGSTFVLVKDLIGQVPPMFMLTIRFAIAALALTLFVTIARRWAGFCLRELAWGAGLGITIGLGYAFQTVGLQYTTASNAGFITGLQVVIAPVLAIVLLRQMPSRWAIVGIVMATVGLGMLSLRIDEGIKLNPGDALVFLCAIAFGAQIAMLGHAAHRYDPMRLALVQIVVAGVINGAGSMLLENPPAAIGPEIWVGIAFLGIMATAVGFGVQAFAQGYTTVVHAALIITLEPVFAAIFGFWLQGDRLGAVALAGAALIVGGMLVAELAPYVAGRGKAQAREMAPVSAERRLEPS